MTNVAVPRPPSDRRAVLWWLAGLFALIGLGLTLLIAVPAVTRPDWAVTPGLGTEWWQAGPDDEGFLVAILLAWALAMRFFASARGRRRFMEREWVVLLAVLNLGLGAASYAPCRGDSTWASLIVWTIKLLTGQVEDSVIGPAATTACVGELPLAFQAARLAGVSTVLLAAASLLIAASMRGLDRWWTWWARDIDIVAGLNAESVPLVRALLEERARERAAKPWYHLTLAERLGRLLPHRSGVVVLRATLEDVLLTDVKDLGAHVYIADPTSRETWERILLRWQRSIPLRRLFAVSVSQSRNIDVVEAARAAIDTGLQSVRRTPYNDVPRLIARLDDPNGARAWRLANLDVQGCFLDAITTDELLARQLVVMIRDTAHNTVVLAGDTPLTTSLLDELALTEAFDEDLHGSDPGQPARPPRSVVVCQPRAVELVAEWQAGRNPSAVSDPFVVTASELDWEHYIATNRVRMTVIVTEPFLPETPPKARRIAQLNPQVLIACRSPYTQGVDLTDPLSSLITFGPTLLQSGGVPEDSWTVLARHNHDFFTDAQSTRPASRPWGSPTDPPEARLPDFLREDTLRQERLILQQVEREHFRWLPAVPGHVVPALPDAVVERITEAEHRRWCDLRVANGWRWGPRSSDRAEDDRNRRNHNLVDLASGTRLGATPPGVATPDEVARIREQDRTTVLGVIGRLKLWGIVGIPVYERTGAVVATRLTKRTSWVAESGEELVSESGDWWVTDEDGTNGRGVAPDAFARTYVADAAEPGRYLRVGRVAAHRAAGGEVVHTLEGEERANAGDWIVVDELDNAWPVPAAQFSAGYRRLQAAEVTGDGVAAAAAVPAALPRPGPAV